MVPLREHAQEQRACGLEARFGSVPLAPAPVRVRLGTTGARVRLGTAAARVRGGSALLPCGCGCGSALRPRGCALG